MDSQMFRSGSAIQPQVGIAAKQGRAYPKTTIHRYSSRFSFVSAARDTSLMQHSPSVEMTR
jgi:hypothetical protein